MVYLKNWIYFIFRLNNHALTFRKLFEDILIDCILFKLKGKMYLLQKLEESKQNQWNFKLRFSLFEIFLIHLFHHKVYFSITFFEIRGREGS